MGKKSVEKVVLADTQLAQMRWSVMILLSLAILALSVMQSVGGSGMDVMMKDVVSVTLR
ncbi:hypothetical protein FWD07_02850 [Candidatus Saccharibacteria bacterium]|nr:hypothetical protein [Candidatus Saccharibacteria bacterium]